MFAGYNFEAFIWDCAIAFLFAGFGWLGLQEWRRWRCGMKRRSYLSVRLPSTELGAGGTGGSMVVLCTLACGILLYGSLIEPHMITVNEFDIDLPAKEDLTIVVISDIHVGPYKRDRYLRRVVGRVNALHPDLILLPGDFTYLAEGPLESLAPLRDLHATYGVYASLGNHAFGYGSKWIFFDREHRDESLRIQRGLERLGITVLRNSWVTAPIASGEIIIGGVDDPYSGKDRIRDALPDIRRKAPLILLSHSPEILMQTESRRPHLIVSGHTHGGQIRLPFIGPILLPSSQLGRSYDQGLFRIDGESVLALSRGIGESSPRARLFCPPEIMVLHAKGVSEPTPTAVAPSV